MKAITLPQPWASLCLGYCDVINRNQPIEFSGPLLIHAAKQRGAWSTQQESKHGKLTSDFQRLPLSKVIGIVYISRCTPSSKSRWHIKGKYGMLISRFQALTPWKCSGNTGLWDCNYPHKGEIAKFLDQQNPPIETTDIKTGQLRFSF